VSAAKRRSALEQFEAIRGEHAHKRSLLHVGEALDGGAVGRHVLGRSGLESDGQLVAAVVVAQPDNHARSLRSKAHQLALGASTLRVAGAAEVERLEQVRLAGAVGTMDDGQAVAEMSLGPRIGAKVAQLHAENQHLTPFADGP